MGNGSRGENEGISDNQKYYNLPRETDKSSASEEDCIPILFGSEKADKWLADSSSYKDDYQRFPWRVGHVKFMRQSILWPAIKRTLLSRSLFKYLTSKACV